MTSRLQFWFEFASPYSYLAAMRIEDLAAEFDVEIDWRPFLLGAIFKKDLGDADSPFNRQPKKSAYMWRDISRQCTLRDLPPMQIPDPFPQIGILPARIACHLLTDSRLPHFVRSVYCGHFQRGENLGDSALMQTVLSELGFDAGEILQHAKAPSAKQKLKFLTDEADKLGLFGAPFFVAEDGEAFWGDDRLETALQWACKTG